MTVTVSGSSCNKDDKNMSIYQLHYCHSTCTTLLWDEDGC